MVREARIKDKAFVVGIAPNRLPDYLGGTIGKTALADHLAAGTLPQNIADKIDEALEVMQQMRAKADGLPFDWAQSAVIRPVFEQRLREYRETKDPMISKYCVVRVGLNYFNRITAGEVMTRPDPNSCATFEDPALADQVVAELIKIGRKADVHVVRLMRRRSETVRTLAEIGFNPSEGQDVA